jgi:serine/threonine-protein kinase
MVRSNLLEPAQLEEVPAWLPKLMDLLKVRARTLDDMVTQAVPYLSRDFPSAESAYRKALDLDRSDPSLHYHLAWPLEQMGRFDESIALHRKAVELSEGASLYRAALAYSYALSGLPEEARRILGELLQEPEPSAFDIAIVHVGLGETQEAVGWLEKSYEARDSHLIYINRDPRFDPLRKDPRFVRLIERIDWPEGDAPLPAGT